MPSQRNVNTQGELAKAIGVERRQLADWKNKGAPIGDKGPYNVAAIKRWAAENLPRSKPAQEKDGQKPGGSLHRRKLAAEVRIKEALADQEEAARDKLRGTLIEVEEAIALKISENQRIKQALTALPRSIAAELATLDTPAEVESVLMTHVCNVLEVLSGPD